MNRKPMITALILILVMWMVIAYQWNSSKLEQAPETKEASEEITDNKRDIQKPVLRKTVPARTKISRSKSPLPVLTLARQVDHGRKSAFMGVPENLKFKVVGKNAVAHGDILLGQVDFETSPGIEKGQTTPAGIKLWESSQIPYMIDEELKNPNRINLAIDYFNSNTAVEFVPLDEGSDQDGIIFKEGDEHCYSYLGRVGGIQPIYLAGNCMQKEITHEIMHALGFIHEQSRTDRDDYVSVNWDNIDEKYFAQYERVPELLMDLLRGTTFDFQSIMLYDPKTFAIDPEKFTMFPLTGIPIAPSKVGLSEEDKIRLSDIYGAR